MIKKIVSILVLALLVSSALPAVGKLNDVQVFKSPLTDNANIIQKIKFEDSNRIHLLQEPQMDILDGEPSDIWIEDEIWTYQLSSIDKKLGFMDLNISKGDLSLIVDSTSPNYRLNIDGNIDQGSLKIYLNENTYVKADLKQAEMGGDLTIRKTDLGIKQINTIIIGKLGITTNIELPGGITIPSIPAAFTIDINFVFDNPLLLIDFPLYVCKYWDLPNNNVTINGKISSFWLWFIKFCNGIYPFFDDNLIELFSGVTLFKPDINIKKLLELYTPYKTNVIPIPEVLNMFHCVSEEIRNVKAGDFNTYDITVPESGGNFYFAPDVHHIIEMEFEDLHLELKEHAHPRFVNTRFV